jgi:hypothetical protein
MCDHLYLRRQVRHSILVRTSDSVPNEILHVLHSTGLVLYSAVVTVHDLSLLPFLLRF